MTCAAPTHVATKEAQAQLRIRAETISSYQEFLDLEPAWNELVKAAGVDHPFLEHAWVRTWWECFGEDSVLHVVAVKAGDEIIAIAPLILTRVKTFGIPLRRLGFFYNAHVPRAGFLVRRGFEEAYRAIWDHLFSERASWDLLQLCQLPEGSATLDEVRSRASDAKLPWGAWLSGASPYVSLDTSWRQYYDSLAAKHRSNLRNRSKRLNQAGQVEMETVTAEEDVPAALDDGLRLEGCAWKRDAGSAISCDPRVQKFYETFARRAAEKNWLHLNFLTSGGQRVAFDYSLSYQNQIFLLKLGYDPAFSAYSPSNLLLSMAMENAFDQGLAKYDFLGENADWKSSWTKKSTANYWLFVFSNSFKGRCLHFLKFRVSPWVKSLRTGRSTKELAI